MEEQLTPTPPLPAQKPNYWIWIGVCVAMLAAGIGIGLFLEKNIYPPLQTLSTPTPSPIAVVDPTANWKTYTSPTYGFSFKYPPELNSIQDKRIRFSNVTKEQQNEIEKMYEQPLRRDEADNQLAKIGYYDIELTIDEKPLFQIPAGENNHQSITLNYSNFSDYVNSKGPVGIRPIEYQLQGRLAAKTTISFISGDITNLGGQLILQILDSNRLIRFVGTSNDIGKNSLEKLDQILSTFKFVEQAGGVDTSNWKTYSNSQYNLEFKYPPTWLISSNTNAFQGGDIVGVGIQNCCGITISKPIKTSSSIEEYINLNIISASLQSGGIQYKNSVKTVNNEEAVESKPVICGGRCFVYTYFKHNGSMYGILSSTSDETPYSNYSEVFNQVLSTFKFTN